MKKKRRRGNGEGTIFEDKKNKRWIGQYISGIAEDGKAIRTSVYGKTQKEVVNKLNEVKYQMNNDIYVENRGDEEWIYLYPFFRAESNIAERLKALDRYKNLKYISDFTNEIKKQEKLLDIHLSDKQKEAVNQINEVSRSRKNKKK